MCYITNLTGTSGGGKVTKMSMVASYYSGACHVPIYDGIHADIGGRTSFLCGQSLSRQSEFLRYHLLQPCRQPVQRIQHTSSSEFQPNYCKAKTRNFLSVICILCTHQNQINWVAVVQLVLCPRISYTITFFLAEERFK